jgi:mannose-1-phosphate guanylyltransferase
MNGHRVRSVKAFLEKPGLEKCRAAMAAGSLWSTLVLAARVETFWTLGWRYLPEMMSLFEIYGEAVGTAEEEPMLEAIYQAMPTLNFSSHFLQRIPNQVAVVELNGVLWCDWGQEERIVETLRRIGKQPRFPLEQVAAG